MTALDSRVAPAAPDPQFLWVWRCAREVRRGWHVRLDGVWRLVENADPRQGSSKEHPSILITVRVSLRETRTVILERAKQLRTRTVAEQIQYVEALRLAQMPRFGLGPVGRVHFDQQVMAAVAEGIQSGGVW